MGEAAPKEYVHLHDETAVLARKWCRTGPDSYSVTVEWPDEQGSPYITPMLVPQTVRQAGLVIAHAELGVPLSHQTLLKTLNYTADPSIFNPRNKPTVLSVDIVCAGKGRSATTSGRAIDFTVRHDGRTVIRADSEFGWISPVAYRRIRGDHLVVDWGEWPLPGPAAPSLVGRRSASEVVISPTDVPLRWQLRNVAENRTLFDHRVDHVPGLVLVEAACQAVESLTRPGTFVPAVMRSRYMSYVEFDEPCWIEATVTARAAEASTVRVTGIQGGRTAFEIELRGAGVRAVGAH
ncbi:ScbA/BarX family gamma-butyrolactone biosynthesis protein [Streptomyces sp. NPDC059169]|uniref:ScbA/BarX family gamma-butyrolactone biosynthesis protein n=1 Tax=unclassified Streptomyces TaxID=2593676 RepID=UPI0036898FA3